MKSLSGLTPKSQRALCRAINPSDHEAGALLKTPDERQEWERRMIIKYNFKVRP
jgi:hypothetical protein